MGVGGAVYSIAGGESNAEEYAIGKFEIGLGRAARWSTWSVGFGGMIWMGIGFRCDTDFFIGVEEIGGRSCFGAIGRDSLN